MIRVNSNDTDRLQRYQIVCHHVRETQNNWICLPEVVVPRGLLTISISGDGNEVIIAGSLLPIGTIHLVESNSKAEISCSSVINIPELWLYGRSRFYLDECRAIYGLHAWIYNDTTLSIGKNCLISDHVRMRTSDHHSIIDLATLQQINFPGDICLKEQVWIGQGVTILKGVEIGEGSIVASSALVSRSIPHTELWGGVPARCLRRNVSWVESHPALRSDVEAMAAARSATECALRPIQAATIGRQRRSLFRPFARQATQLAGVLKSRLNSLNYCRNHGLFGGIEKPTYEQPHSQETEAQMPDGNSHKEEQLISPHLDYEMIVECAYNAIMLRPSDNVGRTYWANLLAENHVDFKSFLSSFFSSAEFSTKLRLFLDTYLGTDRPLINDHSQNGEVSILLTSMINTCAKHRIVVDAGAHGKMGSNSYDLMRYFGWRGVLIEANPELAEKIKMDFQGLDYKLFQVAVSNFDGTTPLYIGVHPEISSIKHTQTASWGEVSRAIDVPVKKLSEILLTTAIPKDFDLLSIDTEGEDFNILSDIITQGFRPEWILMEAHMAAEIESLQILPLPPEIIQEYDIVGRTRQNLLLHRRAPK